MDADVEAALAQAPYLRHSVETGQTLVDFIKPTVLQGPTNGICASLWAIVSLETALAIVSVYLMVRLIVAGNYWVLRRVKVRRGWIIVPSSSNAAALFWLGYTLMDLSCRATMLSWWCYGNLGGHWILLPMTLRYGACLWAVFCHVASSALIWPLSPSTVHPTLWHVFFFGVTALVMAGALVPIALTAKSYEAGQVLYRVLLHRLENAGRLGTPPLAEDVRTAAAILDNAQEGARYLGGLAALAACAGFIVLVLCVVIGRVLLGRLWSAQRRLARDDDEGGTASILPVQLVPAHSSDEGHQATGTATTFKRATLQSASRRGPLRAGFQRERLGVVGVAQVRRLFRRFFWHLLWETTLIGTLGAAATAFFIYTAITIIPAFSDHEPVPRWGNKAGQWLQEFHSVEMWTFMIIGNAYALSVLIRQGAPLRLDTSTGAVQLDRQNSLHSGKGRGSSDVNIKITQDVVRHVCAVEVQPMPRELHEGRLAGKLGNRSSHVVPKSAALDSYDSGRSTYSFDPTGFVGRGVGRSLVLEALADSRSSTLMDRIAPGASTGYGPSQTISAAPTQQLHERGLRSSATAASPSKPVVPPLRRSQLSVPSPLPDDVELQSFGDVEGDVAWQGDGAFPHLHPCRHSHPVDDDDAGEQEDGDDDGRRSVTDSEPFVSAGDHGELAEVVGQDENTYAPALGESGLDKSPTADSTTTRVGESQHKPSLASLRPPSGP